MSLIIAAAVLAMMAHEDPPPRVAEAAMAASAAASPSVAETAGSHAARGWAALLDQQSWDASWDKAGTLFQTQMPKARWPQTIRPVREPLGAATARVLQTVTRTASLPGAPPGEYEVVQFQTHFAHKPDAIETIVAVHEGAEWKIDGYFIR